MTHTINRRTLLTGLAAAVLQTSFPAMAGATPEYLKSLSPEKRAEFEAQHARMMAALPYERVTVPGAQAWSEWQRLKTAGRGWPVIVGNDEGLERIAEQFSLGNPEVFTHLRNHPGRPAPRAPEETILLADQMNWPTDYVKWLKANGEETSTLGDIVLGTRELFARVLSKQPDPRAKDRSEDDGLSVAYDYKTRKPADLVHILLIPTNKGWEVPAYLRWGNWNACPPDEYHVAALHAWHERYGAELVGINGDTMNLRASRPPTNRDAARSLAKEQYRYCSDIVDQGVGSVTALANSLLNEPWWYFWWD